MHRIAARNSFFFFFEIYSSRRVHFEKKKKKKKGPLSKMRLRYIELAFGISSHSEGSPDGQ